MRLLDDLERRAWVSTATGSAGELLAVGTGAQATLLSRCAPCEPRPVSDVDVIKELRVAADALNEGDPRPFAALMADDSEWRGVQRGHLWWKSTPACHGPSEALEVMTFQIKKRGDNRLQVRPEFTRVDENTIIGSSEWMGTDGRRQVRYQVLRFREGKIVDMQGCSSRRAAERFARRH